VVGWPEMESVGGSLQGTKPCWSMLVQRESVVYNALIGPQCD
jgi:hypothetical protein